MGRLEITKLVQRSGPVSVNCYFLRDTECPDALVIDPGGEAGNIVERLVSGVMRLKYIVLTHGHFDHIMCTAELRRLTGAQICMSAADEAFICDSKLNAADFAKAAPVELFTIDRYLAEGNTLDIGDVRLQVIETPGHTPGELSLYTPGSLFCGDTILRGTTGRMDLAGADRLLAAESIRRKIFPLPYSTTIYCGHGPESSVAYEKAHNDINYI